MKKIKQQNFEVKTFDHMIFAVIYPLSFFDHIISEMIDPLSKSPVLHILYCVFKN